LGQLLVALVRRPTLARRRVLPVVVDDLLDRLPQLVELVLRAVASHLPKVAVPLTASHPCELEVVGRLLSQIGLGIHARLEPFTDQRETLILGARLVVGIVGHHHAFLKLREPAGAISGHTSGRFGSAIRARLSSMSSCNATGNGLYSCWMNTSVMSSTFPS